MIRKALGGAVLIGLVAAVWLALLLFYVFPSGG